MAADSSFFEIPVEGVAGDSVELHVLPFMPEGWSYSISDSSRITVPDTIGVWIHHSEYVDSEDTGRVVIYAYDDLGELFGNAEVIVSADSAVYCCVPPIRGDIDYDGSDVIDIVDLTLLVNYMFKNGPEPPCLDEGDVNGSAEEPLIIDIVDLTYLVNYMFKGGPEPAACP